MLALAFRTPKSLIVESSGNSSVATMRFAGNKSRRLFSPSQRGALLPGRRSDGGDGDGSDRISSACAYRAVCSTIQTLESDLACTPQHNNNIATAKTQRRNATASGRYKRRSKAFHSHPGTHGGNNSNALLPVGASRFILNCLLTHARIASNDSSRRGVPSNHSCHAAPAPQATNT